MDSFLSPQKELMLWEGMRNYTLSICITHNDAMAAPVSMLWLFWFCEWMYSRLTMVSSASSSLIRFSFMSIWERRMPACSVASLVCLLRSHFSLSSMSFSLARAFTASSLSCRNYTQTTFQSARTQLEALPPNCTYWATGYVSSFISLHCPCEMGTVAKLNSISIISMIINTQYFTL